MLGKGEGLGGRGSLVISTFSACLRCSARVQTLAQTAPSVAGGWRRSWDYTNLTRSCWDCLHRTSGTQALW